MWLMRLVRMSWCCCLHSPCPVRTPRNPCSAGTTARTGEGAQLVRTTWEDAVDYPEYALSRNEMDIALLREQYKWTKEKQMRQDRVVVFRRVSEDLADALRIIPVTQGPSPLLWDTDTSEGPPDFTLQPVDPTPMTPDPWHVHLDFHRRNSRSPAVAVTLTPPPWTGSIDASHWPPSHRRHASLSEAGSSKPRNKVERYSAEAALNGSCPNLPREDPLQGPHQLDGFLKIPTRGGLGGSFTSTSEDCSFPGSLTSFEESSTPAGYSLTPSACSSVTDPNETGEYDRTVEGRHGGYGLAYHAFRQLSLPASTPSRHQRLGVQHHPPAFVPEQHQPPDHFPFPSRRSVKRSEAAKKLGMYSSF